MAVPLAVAQIAVAVIGAASAANASRRQASSAGKAANATANSQIAELTRQQQEINKASRAQKSDRANAADRERATLFSVASARGAAGSSLVERLVGQSLHFEAEDIGRINEITSQQIASAQAEKHAVAQAAKNAQTIAINTSRTASTGALFSAVGSGIQIASAAYGRHQDEERAKHRTRGDS